MSFGDEGQGSDSGPEHRGCWAGRVRAALGTGWPGAGPWGPEWESPMGRCRRRRDRPLRKNCLCPARLPAARMAPSRPTTPGPGTPSLRREWGPYPTSPEGLHVMAGPPDAQLGTQRPPEVICGGVRVRLWRGHLAWPHSGLTGACSAPKKGSLRAWGSQTVHLGRAQRGCTAAPSPEGSAGTSCPWLAASPQGGAQELSSKFFKPPGHRFPIRLCLLPAARHRADLR